MTARPALNLADQLFLVAHDEQSGAARVHGDVLGVTLASALLAELMLTGHVALADEGTVLLLTHDAPWHDALAHRVFGMIRTSHLQGQYKPTLGEWVDVLASDARDAVGARLCDTGLLTREVRRRPLRRVTVFPPASEAAAAWAAWSATRLHGELHHWPMTTSDALLAALAYTVGLDRHLVFGCDQPHPSLADLTAALPPPLQELLRRAWTQIAVSTMSPR